MNGWKRPEAHPTPGPGEYWVVEVRDVPDPDPEMRMGGYIARFRFEDPVEAWDCWAAASRAGFLASAEHVRDEKARQTTMELE